MKQHSKVWFAKRTSLDNAEVKTFSEPESLYTRNNYFTVMPASSRGYAEVMKYGETLNDVWTVIANSNYFDGVFKIGDVFYVDGERPNENLENTYGYGCTANAVVKAVAYVDRTIGITLVRNQAQVKS